MLVDYIALDFLGNTFAEKKWIFAKSMPTSPHWYTLRKEWGDDNQFNDCVTYMRHNSYVEYFHKKPFQMININGMKYWTMGAAVESTILINRTFKHTTNHYDRIATNYDKMFSDEDSLKENADAFKLLNFQEHESVLDIGCGTGLALKHINPSKYLGIDPAQQMIKVLKANFPDRKQDILHTAFEEYVGPKVDLVISMFAAASYIHPHSIKRILDFVKVGGRFFIMFYRENYVPVTYTKSGILMSHYKENHKLLNGKIELLNQFVCVSGQKTE